MLCGFSILIFLMVYGFQLKMRAGGMSESSKWKKQKRSPRPPRHVAKVSPATEQPAANASAIAGRLRSIFRDQTAPIPGLIWKCLYLISLNKLFCIHFFFYDFNLVLSDCHNKYVIAFLVQEKKFEGGGIHIDGRKLNPVANMAAFLCLHCALQEYFIGKGNGDLNK